MSSYFNDDDEGELYESENDSLKEEEDEEEYIPKKKGGSLLKGNEEDVDEDDLEVDADAELEEDVEQYGGVDDIAMDDDDEVIVSDDDEVDEENVDLEEDEDQSKENAKKQKKIKSLPENVINTTNRDEYDDADNDDDDGEIYLKKFDKEITQNYIMNFHPECVSHNYDEIETFTKVVRDKNGIVIDDLHKTVPYLTKYERTRILGQRAKQINAGATPFVKVPENVIDGYLIAELELQQKRIPFIIRRPLPNGGSEYWNVKDLESISF
uniref:DNA-directed RNA polymerase n=1 Tax=viral metagenome TaxID=1070528 RepID=A0A6C0E3I0_9ZZZZ